MPDPINTPKNTEPSTNVGKAITKGISDVFSNTFKNKPYIATPAPESFVPKKPVIETPSFNTNSTGYHTPADQAAPYYGGPENFKDQYWQAVNYFNQNKDSFPQRHAYNHFRPVEIWRDGNSSSFYSGTHYYNWPGRADEFSTPYIRLPESKNSQKNNVVAPRLLAPSIGYKPQTASVSDLVNKFGDGEAVNPYIGMIPVPWFTKVPFDYDSVGQHEGIHASTVHPGISDYTNNEASDSDDRTHAGEDLTKFHPDGFSLNQAYTPYNALWAEHTQALTRANRELYNTSGHRVTSPEQFDQMLNDLNVFGDEDKFEDTMTNYSPEGQRLFRYYRNIDNDIRDLETKINQPSDFPEQQQRYKEQLKRQLELKDHLLNQGRQWMPGMVQNNPYTQPLTKAAAELLPHERLGMVAGGMTAGLVASVWQAIQMAKQIKHVKEFAKEKGITYRRTSDRDMMERNLGIPKDMPLYVGKGARTEDAFYMPGWSAGLNDLDNPNIEDGERKKRKSHGYVSVGKSMSIPSVVSHELGHARIGNRPWYSPSKFNQNFLIPVGDVLNNVAVFAAPVVGATMENPWVGAAIGGGAGLVTGLPQLFNEWQASNFAKKNMKKLYPNETDESIKENKKALRHAYNTYLIKNIVPHTVGGFLGGAYTGGLGWNTI